MKKINKILLIGIIPLLLSGCKDPFDFEKGKESEQTWFDDSCKHKFGGYYITVEPTCVSRGYVERVCSLCGTTQEKTLKPDPTSESNHKWVSNPNNDREGNCCEKSIINSKICEDCGALKEGTEGDYGEHHFVNIDGFYDETVQDATCCSDGSRLQKCEFCDETAYETDYALGHVLSNPINYGGQVSQILCKTCTTIIGYQLNISDATGWNIEGEKFVEGSESTWNIENEIPAGLYDITVEAMLVSTNSGSASYYSDDTGKNNKIENGKYAIKLDGTTINPTTENTFAETGLSKDKYAFGTFIEHVQINEGAKEIKLVHEAIGFSLKIKSLRLTPHKHRLTSTIYFSNYTLCTASKCDCGYRLFSMMANVFGGQGAILEEYFNDEGLFQLKENGDSVGFYFHNEENIKGELSILARKNNYSADKNECAYNCTWRDPTGGLIKSYVGTEKYSQFLGNFSDYNAGYADYSKLARIPIGECTLAGREEDSYFEYTANGTCNPAIHEVDFEGYVI